MAANVSNPSRNPIVGKPNGMTTVSFVCQQCNSPCKLDSSINSETKSGTTQELLNAVTTLKNMSPAVPPQHELASPAIDNPIVYKEVVSLRQERTPPSAVNVELGSKTSLFHFTQVAQNLFNIMSGSSNVDHPLCEDCKDTLLDQLDVALRDAEGESAQCKGFFDSLLKADEAGPSTSELTKELSQLTLEEADLVSKLKQVDEERANIKREMKVAEANNEKLQEEDARYWREFNEYHLDLKDFLEDNAAIAHKYTVTCKQLEKLKKTNVFNDVFHIWHDGHFGTINNFRLGRLPSVPVGWDEINAAWGQTVLLLHTMAMRLGFKFKRYRLVPNGSHSRLERLDDQSKELPLYGSSGFKLFWESKFDQAMVAFLDCLQQFKDHVESRDVHFNLPYSINKDRIGDSNGELSVRIQLNHEETWTKALKFMLTNLKWCLAWVCKQMS
eukprot:m.27481 g.27481  ORF g.27481 m.27481 type:complete len:443 (+) comp15755_c0_seq2:137-1465(+)